MKLSKDDTEWSNAVKTLNLWACKRCGHRYSPKDRGLNAHHIFTRSRKSTRHEIENGVALCVGCHSWAHRNPLEFHQWIKDTLGAERYDALQQRSRVLKRTGA